MSHALLRHSANKCNEAKDRFDLAMHTYQKTFAEATVRFMDAIKEVSSKYSVHIVLEGQNSHTWRIKRRCGTRWDWLRNDMEPHASIVEEIEEIKAAVGPLFDHIRTPVEFAPYKSKTRNTHARKQ